MQYITKLKLAHVHLLCDEQDKSTEFMIQYMQDTCNVDHDCVMNYLSLPNKEIKKLRKELNSLVDFLISFNVGE